MITVWLLVNKWVLLTRCYSQHTRKEKARKYCQPSYYGPNPNMICRSDYSTSDIKNDTVFIEEATELLFQLGCSLPLILLSVNQAISPF